MLAKTGRYYAIDTMLVRDAQAGRYDVDVRAETLFDRYAMLMCKQRACNVWSIAFLRAIWNLCLVGMRIFLNY